MNKMKAYIYKEYGTPDVLKLEEVAQPIPKANEVLVKVHSLSINPAEWHKLTASFWMLRLATGIFKPKQKILSADIAGTVEAIGNNVSNLKVGERVFGRCLQGGLAEYCCIETEHCTNIPDNISFENASTLPLAAVTALISLRDKAQINKGEKVLINGASGGIGTFAIQLSKHFDADVTSVCSTQNIEFVKSLGADYAIDFTYTDFSKGNVKYDIIIDLVGNRKIKDLFNSLNSSGRCVLVGMQTPRRLFSNIFKGKIHSLFSKKRVLTLDTKVKSLDLEYIANLTNAGTLRPCIDKKFLFKDTIKAFELIGKRRTKGKLVINILS